MKSLLLFLVIASVTGCHSLPEETPMAVVARQMLRDEFGGPKKGQHAPVFRAKNSQGERVRFPGKNGKASVLLTGSYSCPIFRTNIPGVKALHRDYGERVNFYYLYTVEAHPVGSHSPYRKREWVTRPNRKDGILLQQPQTFEARLALAKKAQRELEIDWPILVDDMENNAWKAYGKAPSAAYLISPKGIVLTRQGWVNPAKLKNQLDRL